MLLVSKITVYGELNSFIHMLETDTLHHKKYTKISLTKYKNFINKFKFKYFEM